MAVANTVTERRPAMDPVDLEALRHLLGVFERAQWNGGKIVGMFRGLPGGVTDKYDSRGLLIRQYATALRQAIDRLERDG